jgi:hypothetical protein
MKNGNKLTGKAKHHVTDWRDAANYPTINGTKSDQWAWEFLRRSRYYASDVDAVRKLMLNRHDKKTKLPKKWNFVMVNIPEYLPDDWPVSQTLLPWKCFPPASPISSTLNEYVERVGHRPNIGIRRDLLIPRRWGLSKPVRPEQSYEEKLVKFKTQRHRPESIDLDSKKLSKPRHIELGLMPYEAVVVLDLTDIAEQIRVLNQKLKDFSRDESAVEKLGPRRKTKKHSLLPHELWAMLRLADAIREYQVKNSIKPNSLSQEFDCAGFGYQAFLTQLTNEASGNLLKMDDSHRIWITQTLRVTQLKNWSRDHLSRLICHRGYLALLG